MAMEVIQVIGGAHEDSIVSLAYNRVKREVYSVAEGDKAIKVCLKANLMSMDLATVAPGTPASHEPAFVLAQDKLYHSHSREPCIA